MKFHKELAEQSLSFLKWLLFSAVIGIVVGCVGAGFSLALGLANDLRIAHPWLLAFLPLGGILIVFLYRAGGLEKDPGTNLVLRSARDNANLPLRMAPLVFLSTAITHLLGGSSGREGAVLQIGGSVSSALGHLLHVNDRDSRVFTMCGMAAGFAALFGTPLAASLFAMEVVNVGLLGYSAIVPCLLSSVIAVEITSLFGIVPSAYTLTGIPQFGTVTILQSVVMGILIALLSILFCEGLHKIPRIYDKLHLKPIPRVIVGALIVIVLTFVVWLWNPGTFDYNGAGGQVIVAAVNGEARPEAFLLKILFTALTLGAGFKGGEIVPTLFVGSTFGCVAAPLVGLSPSFGAGLGMVTLFCGVTNCPIASFLLALELFSGGSEGMIAGHGLYLFAISIAVCYMLSGYYGLYNEQKILYSKSSLVKIDRKANESSHS